MVPRRAGNLWATNRCTGDAGQLSSPPFLVDVVHYGILRCDGYLKAKDSSQRVIEDVFWTFIVREGQDHDVCESGSSVKASPMEVRWG